MPTLNVDTRMLVRFLGGFTTKCHILKLINWNNFNNYMFPAINHYLIERKHGKHVNKNG